MNVPRVKLNPGSEAASLAGCTCPVIDNHHGQGRPALGGPVFVMNGDCPLHGRPRLVTHAEVEASLDEALKD